MWLVTFTAEHSTHMHLIPTGRVYDGISSRISFVRFVILFFTRGNIFSIGHHAVP